MSSTSAQAPATRGDSPTSSLPPTEERGRGQAGSGRLRSLVRRPEAGVAIAAIALYAFFAFVAGPSGFISPLGTAGWLDTAAEIGVVAIPVSTLLIAGEFDLSVGSVVGLSSMTTAIATTTFGLSIWTGIALALLLAACVGAANAFIVLRTGLGSFIVTLAMMMAVTGTTLGFSRLLANTTSISVQSDGLAHAIFAGDVGPFSATIIWWLAIAAIASWILFKTIFGNWVYATGGDLQSALMNGVPVKRVKTILFISSSLGAALVGILMTLQFNGAETSRGTSFIFSAITASVIGGVLLTGGYGSPLGVSLGAVTYGIVSMGIYYTGWSTDWVSLFLGALVLVAVLMNNYFRRLALIAGSK